MKGSFTLAEKNVPAISVIIPMYNTEKYIGECLDSILAQTFTDYEVIVVDDCSTDKSVAVVESYIPKFEGKLQLVLSEINSNSCPSIPRNTGIKISCGEYIMFIDSDDVIIETALEELYNTAKKFNADVVHCDKFFTAPEETAPTDKTLLREVHWGGIEILEESELLSENIIERLKKFGEYKIFWATCSNFIRRDLVIKNNLSFSVMPVAEDLVFTVYLLCVAKNFVRTPNTFYVWRKVFGSLSSACLPTDERIKRFGGSIFRGIEKLDKFLDNVETLKVNPKYKYGIFEVLTHSNILFTPNNIQQLLPLYEKTPAYQMDDAIRRELEQIEDTTALTAFLFNRMNIFNVKLIFLQNSIAQKDMQLQQFQEKLLEQQAIINQKNLQLQQAKEYLVNQQKLIREPSKNRGDENNFSDTNKESTYYEKLMAENVLIKENIPAISVIIPMYNVEKYVGECLDSILAQTFTDYEVIIVDDCSKDNSAKIVESYIPKFNGKLQLVRSKINSGGAAIPRNTGLKIARGEYVFFMDSDDTITEDAFEGLYSTAENFHADFLHCEKSYRSPDETALTDKNFLKIRSMELVEFVTKPTLVSRKLEDRINDFTSYKFWNAPWIHFFRRDFLVKNNITFPNVRIGDDILFNFYAICLAEDIVRIPNVYYVWRDNRESNTRAVLSVEKYIYRYGNSIMQAIGLIDEFTKKLEFFKSNPSFKYSMFDFFTREHMNRILPAYAQFPPYQLDEFIRRELEQVKDKTALTAFLFGRMNVFNVNLINQQQEIQKLQANLQKSVQYLKNQSEIIESQRAEIEQLKAQLQQIQ